MAARRKWFGGETCKVEGCNEPQKYKGLCGKHYKRMWRYNNTDRILLENQGKTCKIEGCNRPATKLEICEMHYRRQQHSGTTDLQRAPNGAGTINAGGYRMISVYGERVYEHVYLAVKALGHPLPKKAVIHHVTEDRSDNHGPFKLIICPNQAYHLLIHQRMKEKGISFKGD